MYKITKHIYYFFITLILCYGCTSDTLKDTEKKWLQQKKSITVAIYPYYPPYQFSTKNGTIDGILIEYLDLIEKKIGYTFEKKKYTDWDTLLDDVNTNKIDIVLEMQKTENRKKKLNFYSNLFESPFVLVVRDNKFDSKKSIKDFYDKTITVPKGFSIDDYLKRKYPQIAIHNYKNDIDCIRNVQNGTWDAYIGPRAVVNYLMKSENLEGLQIVGDIDYSYKPSIAVNKQHKILNTIIRKTINNVSDAEKNKVLNNWTFSIVEPFYKKSKFWIFLSFIILASLLVITLINFYLKFKIKQKTHELRVAKDKAEENNRIKTNFIQNISHEIRTPMNGIIGFSELLKDNSISTEEKKEYAEIISTSGKELINSMDNILEISKLETSKINLTIVKTDLTTILENVISTYDKAAKDKGLTLTLENTISSQESGVLIDKSKFIKIIKNLIDNSIKFTNTGAITVIASIENDLIVISVSDTGIGIKPKDQELIFQSFSQSEKEISKNFGGLGLGLAIAKKNIDVMKGKISFTSTVNQGTTFTIHIPYQIYAE